MIRPDNFTKIDHRASSVGVSLPKRRSEIMPAPTKYPEPYVEASRTLKALSWAFIWLACVAVVVGTAARWLA